MKVRVKQGGFFYDNRAVPSGEELDVPESVGKDWVAAEIADEVKSTEAPKEKRTRKPRDKQPSERTVHPGPEETRG
jgi:hypothetical protein